MQCPVDGATLVMSERAAIEIDYCPTCRGVWLDRGELDKIIERAVPAGQVASPPPAPQREVSYPANHQSYYGTKKRKEHWLMELFD